VFVKRRLSVSMASATRTKNATTAIGTTGMDVVIHAL